MISIHPQFHPDLPFAWWESGDKGYRGKGRVLGKDQKQGQGTGGFSGLNFGERDCACKVDESQGGTKEQTNSLFANKETSEA